MRRTSRRTCWSSEGLENGHYEALPEAWERQFYIIALGHCEGPDHLARLDLSLKLAEAQKHVMRPELLPMADRPMQQVMRVRSVIERFGRHPHRNADYGRLSSPKRRPISPRAISRTRARSSSRARTPVEAADPRD
jgi:uncharacterized protein (DUF924 family)